MPILTSFERLMSPVGAAHSSQDFPVKALPHATYNNSRVAGFLLSQNGSELIANRGSISNPYGTIR